MANWVVIGGGIEIGMRNGELPTEIDAIEEHIEALYGSVPIEPYPSAIEYDRNNPAIVLAATYNYVTDKNNGEKPVVISDIEMPLGPEAVAGNLY